MIKIIVLFLMLVLSVSVAHAGIFDWITGMVANDQEEKPPTEDQTSTAPTTLYEQVTCKFLNSTSTQTCYASNIDQSCTGTDSCAMTIIGAQGSQFYLKACGGVAYATFDNVDETVEFNCETRRTERQINIKCVFDEATQTKICDRKEIPNINVNVKEQVTCKFSNSTSAHTCYYPNIQDLSCTGTDSCTMTIEGREGSKVDIIACDGVAYVTFDNADETVEFNCEKSEAEKFPGRVGCVFDEATQTQKCDPVPVKYVKEQVTCKFLGSTSTQTCYASATQSCTGTDSCTMTIMGIQSLQPYLKACGQVAYATFDNADETVEFNCEAYKTEKEIKCVFDEATQTQMCYPLDNPAVSVEKVKEQVTCKFLESEQLQKCYSEFGQTCEGKTSCVMDIAGEGGRKATLKSSCGGYAYILIDGNNENAEFKCTPIEEVTTEQIVGRGFQRAAWECYDGANTVSQELGCLPSEVWHKKAELYCKGHCYQDKSKCGINSFSVSEECHEAVTGVARPTVGGTARPTDDGATQPVDLEKLKEEMEESKEETLFCKDSCPLDGKCYPFGYRKKEKFCSDLGAFTDQLQEDLACDNNFECSTNVCVDGKCVSSGLIQKVINWLTKLFG